MIGEFIVSNRKIKNKKIVLILSLVMIFAIAMFVAINIFHIDFVYEKTGIAMSLDDNNILSGDGSEESPITPIKTPEIVTVAPRVFPWNTNDEEFRTYRHKIYEQTLDVSIEYLNEYGQLIDIDYKFLKGTPHTLTYMLCGATDGSEYIVTINFKDKNNPTVSYEKSIS